MKKEIAPVSADAVPVVPPAVSRRGRLAWVAARTNRLFVATVVVPTALAVGYFGLWASDVYISESRYVIRTPQKQSPAGLGALLQGAGFQRAHDDTYSVIEYVSSRDALKRLDAELDLRRKYTSDAIDPFQRFAAIDGDDSFEAFHRYFGNRVELVPDPISSISTLRTRAFTATDAVAVNEHLLQASEELVNKLNERARQDLIRFAEQEVATAEHRTRKAMLAVTEFRRNNEIFDPTHQSAIQLQLVSKLQDELIANRTQLAQVRSISRENPQIPALELRIRTLQSAIDAENRKVAGGRGSLSDQSGEYERLLLEREFADRQLAAAMSSLEQARNEAMRKHLYLERIAQPSEPDIAIEPRRLRAVTSVLLLGLATWGILSMLIAGVREHRD